MAVPGADVIAFPTQTAGTRPRHPKTHWSAYEAKCTETASKTRHPKTHWSAYEDKCTETASKTRHPKTRWSAYEDKSQL